VVELAAVLFGIACGGGTAAATALPSPTGPLVATREPTTPPQVPTLGTFAFTADLRSSSEVPPVADAEGACNGQGRFVLRAKLDPTGTITAATAQFSFFVRDCPSDTKITLAHIHRAPSGQNGAVQVDSGLSAAEALAMGGGGIGFNVEEIPVTDLSTVSDIIANPAGYYFNVHSLLHSGGLIRGQLVYER
jgi:CHRD domain